MSLAAFQEAFSQALLTIDVADNQVESIPHLPPSPALMKQFTVYQKRFLSGLHSILSSAYPTVKNIIGKPQFLAASNDFFLQHPPNNVDPLLICEQFASFIESHEFNAERPFLADIATIDLGCFQSKQAIDAGSVEKSTFTTMPPEQLASQKIQLHPSCFWISSPYAIYDIWQQYNSSSAESNFEINTPQELIILRSSPSIRIYKANPGLVKTLDALDSGEALSSALEQGADVHPELSAVATMQFLIDNDLVTSLY